jgi:hypothetical protein
LLFKSAVFVRIGLTLIKTAFGKHTQINLALEQCLAGLGIALASNQPNMLMVFVGGKHAPEQALHAIRGIFSNAVIVGGSAAGVISRQGLGYSGFEIGITAFYDGASTPKLLVAHNLLQGERQAGFELGQRVGQVAHDDASVVMFFDSVATNVPLRLHAASLLVDGFQSGLGDHRIQLIGGGLLTDFNLSGGWVFDGSEVRKHAAIALVFPESIKTLTTILHGCRPVSAFMEITRIEGAEVFELDGQPALRVVEQMLDLPLGSSRGSELSLIATLGQKQGDRFAPYDENAYVNRLILNADPDRGSITLFEPDFTKGMQVQIMSRDNSLMLESAARGVEQISKAMLDNSCLLAMYIDCAGRASVRSGSTAEEAELVVSGIDPALPLMGFYSGVEIAPFSGGYSRPLDWTGVLTIFQKSQ